VVPLKGGRSINTDPTMPRQPTSPTSFMDSSLGKAVDT
jgi:hypothetical protein